MTTNARLALSSVLVATLAGPGAAWAGNPIELTDGQLDRVTAGEAAVQGSGIAEATGALAITQVNSVSFGTGGATPFPSQPSLTDDAAVTVVTAVAQGTNGVLQGAPPPTSGASVSTQGGAVGNLVPSYSFNATVHGAGGAISQFGYTVVFGIWYGL